MKHSDHQVKNRFPYSLQHHLYLNRIVTCFHEGINSLCLVQVMFVEVGFYDFRRILVSISNVGWLILCRSFADLLLLRCPIFCCKGIFQGHEIYLNCYHESCQLLFRAWVLHPDQNYQLQVVTHFSIFSFCLF